MSGSFISIGDGRLGFKEIFSTYYPSLHHFAFRILKCKHEAEDVVQDVFLTLWKNRPDFQSDVSFRAYLYLCVRNRALDILKKQNPMPSDTLSLESIAEEVDSVVKEEAFRLLDSAIEKLPERSREILKLSLQGLSVKEVAEQLNVTVNTVKTQKQRAYKFLKDNCAFLLVLLELIA
ncbi:MAG: RNA polymerase sigma-70 factor [Tenuifilaceae bacterium]|nr:RNA polymerase sigma-70 factor [Tenuifilaceae bacterium]